MRLYLDASIIVPLLVAETDSEAVSDWFDNLAESACLGRLAFGEAGSALSRKQRMGELTADQGRQALSLLDEIAGSLDIVDHSPADIAAASQLVRQPIPKLLMPDAIHLATCRRLGLCLVSADAELLERAQTEQIASTRPG